MHTATVGGTYSCTHITTIGSTNGRALGVTDVSAHIVAFSNTNNISICRALCGPNC